MKETEKIIIIDMRELTQKKLDADDYKQIFDEKTKTAIRNGKVKIINNDYGELTFKRYSRSYYPADEQAELDKIAKEKGFKKITETIENYSIEIIPSKKARMLHEKRNQELINSNNNEIRLSASKTKRILK